MVTPLKTNMSPENQWLGYAFPTPISPFLGDMLMLPPRKLTWNLKMMVSKFGISSSRGSFSGSMLVFRGVVFWGVYGIFGLLRIRWIPCRFATARPCCKPSRTSFQRVYGPRELDGKNDGHFFGATILSHEGSLLSIPITDPWLPGIFTYMNG